MKKSLLETQVRTTPEFRLKDNPPQRRFQFIHLKDIFGFQPEIIIVEKVKGSNNRIQVSAVVPEDKIKKEEKKVIEKIKRLEEK